MNTFQHDGGKHQYSWCLFLLLLAVHVKFIESESQEPELKLISGAQEKGAVCIDGTPPGYYFSPGFGSGLKNWMVYVEGGAWCKSDSECATRARTYLGSTEHVGTRPVLPNTGILSRDLGVNPDFYNWNVAWLRYCDGASFLGEKEEPVVISEDVTIYYRGARIWDSAMDELMERGMAAAEKPLLIGCSAGGLTAILHCDSFKEKFPAHTSVKCIADAGYFLDVPDIAGGQTAADLFRGVALTHNVTAALPKDCTASRAPNEKWECIFAQNALPHIRTPVYILQSAMDYWQLQNLVSPKAADPGGKWTNCAKSIESCNAKQLHVVEDFRDRMVRDLGRATPDALGEFVISCYAHCMAIDSRRWSSHETFTIHGKTMQQSIGDWFYETSPADVQLIDGPYLSNPTCAGPTSLAETKFAEHLDINFDED